MNSSKKNTKELEEPTKHGKNFTISDITAIICTINEENRIAKCIKSLMEIGIKKIIVVDGHSTDKTPQIVRELNVQLLKDNGIGLGNARNIGIQSAKSKLILNFGADNLANYEAINSMVRAISDKNCIASTCQTMVEGKSYLNWCLNKRQLLCLLPGKIKTAGTPSLFEAKILKKNLFNNALKGSDDSELSDRLRSKYCKQIIRTPYYVKEFGYNDLKSIKLRWKNIYGTSDFENFRRLSSERSFLQNFKSILYPFTNEVLKPFIRAKFYEKPILLPFLI